MKFLMQCRRCLAFLVLAIVSTVPCWAAQVAVLRNGFSIQHERRQVMGATTRLYITPDGSSYVDVPTVEIEHFEQAPLQLAPVQQAAVRNIASINPPSALSLQSPAPKPAPIDLNQVINSASNRYRLDPDLVNSVIKAESGFNVRAVSPKGARGLMQLMPQTASQLGVPNVFDPQANVEGGTRYLRELLEHYNFDLIKALAAYNAGTRRVEQYGGVPPYYETRAYVARIVRDFNKKKVVQKSASQTASKKTGPNQPTVKVSSVSSASPRSKVQSKNQASE